MSSRRLAAVAGFGGTVVLAGLIAAGPFDFGLLRAEIPATPVAANLATTPTAAPEPVAAANGEDDVSIIDTPIVQAALPVAAPPVEIESEQVAPAATPEPPGRAQEAAASVEIFDECLVAEICIDRYLWSVYQRAPKVDCHNVSERVKVTVTKKGKTRTVTKTVSKLVDEDFTWKDPKAAQRVGMSLQDYVIGGMDRSFKLKLYHALRAMDDAGLEPGITSAFRDDYRQAIATGKKAASDSSYHGGSRRGGYGHGMAADLVSVKGATRAQRWLSTEILWKWVDAHGQEFGVGRPYLDRDPPHVGPIDGKEYAAKRGQGRAKTKVARLEPKKRPGSAAGSDRSKTKNVRTASPKAKSS
jgi:hypothetical protein